MTLLLVLLTLYRPGDWLHFPSMDEVRNVTASQQHVYVSVPQGVYQLSRPNLRPARTLTAADGLAGEVLFSAWNQVRPELFVVTDGHLYQYLPATGAVAELPVPFRQVRSIGIAPGAAWFDTDAGLFEKHPVAADFKPQERPPESLRWYGARDTSAPTDYGFLVPWYVVDDQLNRHDLTRVFYDRRARRRIAPPNDYGLTLYKPVSRVSERHVRFGPSGDPVRRIVAADGRLWLQSRDRSALIEPDGTWRYSSTAALDLPGPGLRLATPGIAELDRREGVRALLADSNLVYLGAGTALYVQAGAARPAQLVDLKHPVNGLARLGNDLLVGTDYGLFAYSGDSLAEIRDPFDRTGFGVYAISQTRSGDLWLGTLGGILHRDTRGEWRHIIPPGFDLSRPVYGLAAASDIVFYDNGAGISAYNLADSSFTAIDARSGLPSDELFALYADQRYLWIATPGMVSRYDYAAGLKR